MKTVFLIAGLDIHNTAVDDKYAFLRNIIEKEGYKVIPVDISWRQNTPSNYAREFINIYNANKSKDGNIVIGNSFGAVVAFITASELLPDLVLLCSLSPFFKEDLDNNWPPMKYEKLLGKRRLQDISRYSAHKVVAEINKTNVKFKILYGENEHTTSSRLVSRTIDTAKRITKSKLVEVKNAQHSFVGPEYAAGIINEL